MGQIKFEAMSEVLGNDVRLECLSNMLILRIGVHHNLTEGINIRARCGARGYGLTHGTVGSRRKQIVDDLEGHPHAQPFAIKLPLSQ